MDHGVQAVGADVFTERAAGQIERNREIERTGRIERNREIKQTEPNEQTGQAEPTGGNDRWKR